MYVCKYIYLKQEFSVRKVIKKKQKSRIKKGNVFNRLLLAITVFTQEINSLYANKQRQN